MTQTIPEYVQLMQSPALREDCMVPIMDADHKQIVECVSTNPFSPKYKRRYVLDKLATKVVAITLWGDKLHDRFVESLSSRPVEVVMDGSYPNGRVVVQDNHALVMVLTSAQLDALLEHIAVFKRQQLAAQFAHDVNDHLQVYATSTTLAMYHAWLIESGLFRDDCEVLRFSSMTELLGVLNYAKEFDNE